MPALSQFAAAIAQAEGYNVAGSRPQRNNNPGDLTNWPGVPTDAGGYSVFPDAQSGWNALEQDLNTIRTGQSQYISPDMSIAQMGAAWAGGDPNWAGNVAAALRTTTNAIIGPLLGPAVPIGGPATTLATIAQTATPSQGIMPAAAPSDTTGDVYSSTSIALIVAGAAVLYLAAREIFA
jgi:hypothetical protein